MPFQTGGVSNHNDDQHQGNAKRGAANGLATLNASSKVVEEPASKGLASGVASLDAASLIPLANLGGITNTEISATAAIGFTKLQTFITTGSYASDETQNRAIAHGLSRVPRFVLLINQIVNYTGVIIGIASKYRSLHNTIDFAHASTAWDTTNFYVGSAGGGQGNDGSTTYYWIAVG